jgi:ferredoxin
MHQKKGMNPKMSRREELQELKTRAGDIQVKLDLLEMRIKAIQKGVPATTLWKAFVDAEKCVGCGICKDVCPAGAIGVDECARVEMQICIGCGHCVQECPQEAISLRPSVFNATEKFGSWKRCNRGPISMLR